MPAATSAKYGFRRSQIDTPTILVRLLRSCAAIIDVAEFAHHALDTLACFRGDQWTVVEHHRRRSGGHTGRLRDVFERYASTLSHGGRPKRDARRMRRVSRQVVAAR